MRDDPALAGAFLNALFDKTNWAVSELVLVLEELDATGRGEGRAASQLRRKTAATADLTYWMLRVLEFAATEVPELVLDSGMNVTRLAETLVFAVRQLAAGKAGSVLERRAAASGTTASTGERRVALLPPSRLLRPCAGLLAAAQYRDLAMAQLHPGSSRASVVEVAISHGMTVAQLDAVLKLVWPDGGKDDEDADLVLQLRDVKVPC